MELIANSVGLQYNYLWIFRNKNLNLTHEIVYAITGENGSGKSSLLAVLGGYKEPSEGNVSFIFQEKKTKDFNFYTSLSAPYISLPEELSVLEFLEFHSVYRKKKLDILEMLDNAQLIKSKNKPIKYFSSGMKQRVKLILNFYFENKILLFDEPTSFLDEKGKSWYHNELNNLISKAIIVIASNDFNEFPAQYSEINLSNNS